jgi:bla regulator protein blaR1
MRRTVGISTLLAALRLFAQAPISPPAAPTAYAVASIKPNKSSDDRFMLRPLPGGGLTATGVTLKMFIMFAYGVASYQISGAPNWVGVERWDVEAKNDDEAKTGGVEGSLPLAQSQALLRQLLEDRFQLKTRRETRKMPVYALMVTKSGLKLKPRAGDATGSKPQVSFGFGSASFTDSSLAGLAGQLTLYLDRPVLDRTGIQGDYDFTLKWTPAPNESNPQAMGLPPRAEPPRPADSSGPSIFTALQEQLGLKLESTKGPVDILLIDHVERPSEN